MFELLAPCLFQSPRSFSMPRKRTIWPKSSSSWVICHPIESSGDNGVEMYSIPQVGCHFWGGGEVNTNICIAFSIFTGRLRNIPHLKPWGLISVLEQKCDYPLKQATALHNFMAPMLELDPDDYPSAGELSRHPWLDMEDAAPP